MAFNVRYNPMKPTGAAKVTALGTPQAPKPPMPTPVNDTRQGMGNPIPKPTNLGMNVQYNPALPPQPQGMAPQPNPQWTGNVAPPPVAPPPPQPNTAFDRQGNTLQARVDMLKQREQQGLAGPNADTRIQGLQQRIAGGDLLPDNYNGPEWTGNVTPPPLKTPHPLGDMPPNNSPFKRGELAELAPPRGTNTYFRDAGPSRTLQERNQNIQKNIDKGATKTPKNTPPPGTGMLKPKGKKPVTPPPTKDKTKTPLTDKERKAKLKEKQKRRPQPGTPQRPYINRGVTYSPLGFGGKLRV